MLSPFRIGLGAVIGPGTQVVPWISLDDTISAICQSLFNAQLTGPVNVVSPRPVTHRELSYTLARILHRPCVLRIPAWAVRAMWGEMGRAALLSGARVIPAKLQAVGFQFALATLESTLRKDLAGETGTRPNLKTGLV